MGAKGSGRRTKGRLFKRASGVWALRFVHNGKDKVIGLDTTLKAEAIVKARQYLHPLQAATEVARRKAVADAVKTAEEALAQAKAFQSRIALTAAWKKTPYDHTAPGRGARRRLSVRNTIENEQGWAKFVRFAVSKLGEGACMEDVTPDLAAAYSKQLREVEHLTASRHNKLITIARVMYRLAERPDPFGAVPRYAVRHESRRNLEMEELKTVCTAASGELRRLFAVMLFTGLRLGDAVTLEWSSIRHGRIVRRVAKTGRDIAFPVFPALDAILAEVPESERTSFVCPELARLYLNPSTRSRLSTRIREHLEKCDLSCVEEGSNRQKRVSRLGAHAFRHTFVTLCARYGVPEGAIRDWVGHASVEITRIYAHWAGRESDARILAALPAGVFEASPTAEMDRDAADRQALTAAATTAPIAAVRNALRVMGRNAAQWPEAAAGGQG